MNDAVLERPGVTVMIIDPGLTDACAHARRVLESSFPGAQFVYVKFHTIAELWRRLQAFRREQGRCHYAVLPVRRSFLFHLRYLAALVAVHLSGVGQVRLLNSIGQLLSPTGRLLELMASIAQPVLSVLIIVRLPYYIVREVVQVLIMTKEQRDDEIVGFGSDKGVSGGIYWLYLANKSARYGFFGLAHDSYAGVPLGLHGWPLATFLLQKLGFRRFVYASAGLAAVGLGWLCWSSGHPALIALVPFVLFSTYYGFNIYVGTWEVLAWGFGALAVAALYSNAGVIAGALAGLALLSHPAVGALTSLLLAACTIISGNPIRPLAELALGGTITTLWWLVPYWRARGKLGRVEMINKVWTYVCVWTPKTVYALFAYLTFGVIAFAAEPGSPNVLVLSLPLAVLYYNTKVRWVFSEYTVFNFMLFTGAFYVLTNPHPVAIIAYLIVINPSSKTLWNSATTFLGFDLKPVTMGTTRKRIRDAFLGFDAGRVGFELGRTRAHPGWDAVAAIGYALSDTDVPAFNIAYVEIGDAAVYNKYCRHFNTEATLEEFETASREASIKYMVAFTEQFAERLTQLGYRRLTELRGLRLSPIPHAESTDLVVFELPSNSNIVMPATEYAIEPNKLRVHASAGLRYSVGLTYFPGWRAQQDGEDVEIVDCLPGMSFKPIRDGVVELEYRLSNYWKR